MHCDERKTSGGIPITGSLGTWYECIEMSHALLPMLDLVKLWSRFVSLPKICTVGGRRPLGVFPLLAH